ncbi:hypothetical protein [Pseudothauera rhizosphaerae]|uniref:VCBS repeat-containing protein n=1 Tax=Pseudothauera rhizosphaerae TaxID=2565932 RepID=A0A4V6RX55_9RHOO|nr:hypothetical protein [Pseudothauera rhizosphaerae]THF62517.1 hypothetical protein E6O51_05995 [Pseudothauera rhizosphaerae]
MKIAAADIQMQSSHLSMTHSQSSERLNMWVGERPAERRSNPLQTALASAASQVSLSPDALAAQEADAARTADDEQDALDPSLRVLVRMLEFLTGRPVRLFQADELPRAAGANTSSANAQTSAGFGIEYDYSATHAEFEQVAFQAAGTVRTADGKEIRFELGFEMQRSYVESTSFSLRAGDAQRRLQDPLVFDFGGPAGALSDLRFEFDLDADGRTDDVPLLDGGRGFLAFDRNGNGLIDDGNELFGPTSGDGFAELAALDDDGNGWIDEADAAFARLHVWRPAADGSGSLQTLAEAGVGALYLGRVATPFDIRGAANDTLGVMRSSGIYLNEDGSAGTLSQIDLSV